MSEPKNPDSEKPDTGQTSAGNPALENTTLENTVIEAATFSRADAPAAAPLFAPSPLKVAVLAGFLILASAALFMFNARAVQFTLVPAEAELKILSGLPTYKLGERYLMLRGEYDISANQDGYFPLEETVTVTAEPDQLYQFDLRPLPGKLTVTTSYNGEPVEGAEIYIDQVYVGKTADADDGPASTIIDEVPAGLRELAVKHARFQDFQTEVEITGRRQLQTESLTLSPAWAEVSVTTIPDAAEVLIDGESMGTTPQTIEVIEGERTLLVKKPGFKTFETALSIVAQTPSTLEPIILIKSDGELDIASQPAGVSITIAGTYYGQTPLSIALPPGEDYTMIATRAGYETLTRQLQVKAEQDQSLNLTLQPVLGLVKLAVTPAAAELFVNDKRVGTANRTLELTARTHNLRVELPGYAPFETDVIPQPGLAQQLNIVLQTEAEARVSAIPQRVTTSQGDILRFILPGKLKMGAPRREPGRRSNEVEKDVELTRAYYLGEKEISNQVFKAFDPGHDSGMLGRALLSDPERPVVNVSWERAVAFCNWLSEQDGLTPAYERVAGKWRLIRPVNTGYRLPTEAEWSWAARYSEQATPRFPWGNSMPPPAGSGNFADESAANMVPYSIKGYNDNFRGPAPSGTYQPNQRGVFDLAGNVSEWINDIYSVDLERQLLIDPLGPETGDYYVIRGSNYTHGRFSELRWTYRDYGSDPRPDVGFRIARYLE